MKMIETVPRIDYGNAILPRGEDLPYDDGEPMDTPWHRDAMGLLIESIRFHLAERPDYYVGGNEFIHYNPQKIMNKDFRGPDVYAVFGVDPKRDRKSWVVWEENNRTPDVVIELISPSTARIDRVVKKKLYQDVWKTTEYFCYDPKGPRIQGWRLIEGTYQPIEPEEDWIWSEQLGAYLGGELSKYMGTESVWPRLYNEYGLMVLNAGERAEAEEERANAEFERAEAEADRANAEAHRANAEAYRANAEAKRADNQEKMLRNAEAEIANLKAELASRNT